MKIKERLKKIGWVRKIYSHGIELLCKFATIISPTLNTKIRYRLTFKKKLDLKHPETLNEKVLWLKLNKYMKDPLVIQCADKYRVREYVKQCGCGEILNDLIGVYNSADEIPWDELPNQFVLKWNFGAGMNIVCTDKAHMDKDTVINQMKEWGKAKYWLSHSEMQYKYIPKKIICEKYLYPPVGNTSIPDYKVYCFNGKPLAVLVMQDRATNIKAEFYDTEWNILDNFKKYELPKNKTKCPSCFYEMLKYSEMLSKPFEFVRCDFYILDNNVIFGELTFTPAGGLYMVQAPIKGKDMAEFLDISK